MSFASKNSLFYSGSVQTFNDEIIPLKKEDRPQTQFFFRLSRYVNEKIKKIRSYRTFLVLLKPTEPITSLLEDDEKVNSNIYVKIHIPQTHTLNKTNYTLTLEDLSHRLSKMKIQYPLCVYSSENNPTARLNYQQAMGGSIDGKDYILFVFVAKSELQSYKRRWPNQVLVELPFDNLQSNWKDVARQTIKIFGETLGINYVFMLEDNIYCSYKQNEGKWEPISMLDYFQALQEAAIESQAPLLGSRVTSLGSLNVPIKQNDWENEFVQSAILVKTNGLKEYFGKHISNTDEDLGLVQFNKACNEVGVVQQSQKYLLQVGYSIDDPVIEGNEFRKPGYTEVKFLEPESRGLNLKVKLVSLEVVLNKKLSDGSRYARGLGIVADSTGAIVFVAKNDQVDLKPGQNYSFRNAKIAMFKGWMRLEVDEWGKIEPLNEEVQSKTSPNLSKTEYELVDDQKDRED